MSDATERYIQMIDADNRLLYHRLRESTALLRSALPPDGKDTTRLYGSVEKQIVANEAALKKAEGEKRICKKCKQHVSMLINGRCVDCNPFGACMFCGEGDFHSKPTASWQNRWVCDKCGKEVSQ